MRTSIFLFVFLMVNILQAQTVIESSAPVNDFIIDGNEIIVATTKGTVDVYDITSKKLLRSVKFDKTIDFAGDLFDTEVFKVVKVGNTIIAVTRGENGFNDVYAIINDQKEIIIPGNRINSVIVSIAVSDDNNLLLGLLSNELLKYDIINNEIIFREQISNYAFSAMCIDSKGEYLYVTDESGEVHKVESSSGNVLSNYKGQNVDNVLCIDYSSGIIVCGGKDRRISTYNTLLNRDSHFDTGKFITTIAISPSGKRIAWYDTDTDNVELAWLANPSGVTQLIKHKSMVNKIVFTSETTLVSAGIDNKIVFWNLNK